MSDAKIGYFLDAFVWVILHLEPFWGVWMDFSQIKKVELHRHLEGGIRLETVIDVASEAGVKLPTQNVQELKKYGQVLRPMKNLKEVLDCFGLVQSVLATPSILERITYEHCMDAAADNIRVLELRYAPAFVKQGHENLTYDSIHQAIVDGMQRAEKELKGKLAVGLICIANRDLDKNEANNVSDFAIANKGSFVGFDLAGDEAAAPPKQFEKVFSKVRAAGMAVTVHSGELPTKESAGWVKDSIQYLGAQRIGHGINIMRDPKILDFVRDQKTVLEVCPTSNYLTRGSESLEAHPIDELRKNEILVSLSSDDPGIFDITLSNEYEITDKIFGYGEKEFDAMNQVGLESTFIDQSKALKAWSFEDKE